VNIPFRLTPTLLAARQCLFSSGNESFFPAAIPSDLKPLQLAARPIQIK